MPALKLASLHYLPGQCLHAWSKIGMGCWKPWPKSFPYRLSPFRVYTVTQDHWTIMLFCACRSSILHDDLVYKMLNEISQVWLMGKKRMHPPHGQCPEKHYPCGCVLNLNLSFAVIIFISLPYFLFSQCRPTVSLSLRNHINRSF